MSFLVEDNPARRRFEILVDGGLVGFTAYEPHPDGIVFTHTEVDPDFREMGVGGALARGALDEVRKRGERIIARCPFIASYLRQHREAGRARHVPPDAAESSR